MDHGQMELNKLLATFKSMSKNDYLELYEKAKCAFCEFIVVNEIESTVTFAEALAPVRLDYSTSLNPRMETGIYNYIGSLPDFRRLPDAA